MTACELGVIEPAFNDHVFRDPAGNTPLARSPYIFSISSLEQLITSIPCDSQRLLVVHHGLNNGRVVHGLGMTCGTFLATGELAFEPATVFWVPNGHRHLAPWSDPLGRTWIQQFGDAYTGSPHTTNVYIRRSAPSTTCAPFDPLEDTRYVTFSVDARLKPFLEDNKEVGIRRATHIELVSYAPAESQPLPPRRGDGGTRPARPDDR